MSQNRPRDAHASSTRDALVAAAERLFAEQGVHAVSNRQISEAAGQGNNTAVSYHFGNKQELVRAIVAKHNAAIDVIRDRLIDQISDPEDLRSWVSVAVRSVTEHVETLGRPSWYARFMAQVSTDPALHDLDPDDTLDARESLRTLRDGMLHCLPDLPSSVRTARSTMTRHLIRQVAMDHERALTDDSSSPTWNRAAEDLIDAVVAIWDAPVTASVGTEDSDTEVVRASPATSASAYTYRLRYSAGEGEHVATVVELADLSARDEDPVLALESLIQAVSTELDRRRSAGRAVPPPFALRDYSGQIWVQVSPEMHRSLDIEASERSITLEELIISRIARG